MANTSLLRCGDKYTVALKTWISVPVMLMDKDRNPSHKCKGIILVEFYELCMVCFQNVDPNPDKITFAVLL